jgi:hypothetical protein
MFLLDGKVLQIDTPFNHNGIQYPANWLRLTTIEEKQAIGITEVPDPVRPDERFYYVNTDGSSMPKDIDMLKTNFKKQMDQIAYSMLLPTDWYVIRKQEANVAVPDNISAFRTNVRVAAETNKVSIQSSNTIEELIATMNIVNSTWPIL